jgi:hypothetical protein
MTHEAHLKNVALFVCSYVCSREFLQFMRLDFLQIEFRDPKRFSVNQQRIRLQSSSFVDGWVAD